MTVKNANPNVITTLDEAVESLAKITQPDFKASILRRMSRLSIGFWSTDERFKTSLKVFQIIFPIMEDAFTECLRFDNPAGYATLNLSRPYIDLFHQALKGVLFRLEWLQTHNDWAENEKEFEAYVKTISVKILHILAHRRTPVFYNPSKKSRKLINVFLENTEVRIDEWYLAVAQFSNHLPFLHSKVSPENNDRVIAALIQVAHRKVIFEKEVDIPEDLAELVKLLGYCPLTNMLLFFLAEEGKLDPLAESWGEMAKFPQLV